MPSRGTFNTISRNPVRFGVLIEAPLCTRLCANSPSQLPAGTWTERERVHLGCARAPRGPVSPRTPPQGSVGPTVTGRMSFTRTCLAMPPDTHHAQLFPSSNEWRLNGTAQRPSLLFWNRPKDVCTDLPVGTNPAGKFKPRGSEDEICGQATGFGSGEKAVTLGKFSGRYLQEPV